MKWYMYLTLVLLLLLLPVTDVAGQLPDYPARRFGMQHGVHNNLKQIAQDTDGFIWLMCSKDLQRFDGKHIDTYFEGERMYSLLVDAKGSVWTATAEGIFKFDPYSNRFLKIASEDTTATEKIIFEAETGMLFCISASGIYAYDETLEIFSLRDTLPYSLAPGARISFEFFSHYKYTLYYFTGDTLWRHDMRTGKKDKEAFNEVKNVIALSEHEVIVSNWESKTWYYNFRTGKKMRLSMPGTDSFLTVIDAVALDENRYYLATTGGLLVYKPGTDHLRRIDLSLDGELLPVQLYRLLCKGKSGTVWTATSSNLFCFEASAGNINFIQNNLVSPAYVGNVRNFAEDGKGNLWFATDTGLTYWDRENNSFSIIKAEENADDRLNHPSVRGLVYDGTRLIIGQTNKGVWLYNPKTKKFDRPEFENSEKGRLLRQKIEKDFIWHINTLKNGDHIIAARDGAYLMNGDNYTIDTIDFPGSSHNVRFSYEDSKGNIFIGTFDGLYCLDSMLQYRYSVREQLKTPQICSLLERDNGYYMGAAKGLYFFSEHENTVAIKKVIPALQHTPVVSLFEDTDNAMWIVSGNALHRYIPETDSLLCTFGYPENVAAGSFHTNSYIRKSDGLVFIGGRNGINYFYPEKTTFYPGKLHPYIREISIHEFTATISGFGDPGRLKYYQNTIDINFSTPYYSNPENIRYRYQLTENGSWINLGNNPGLTLAGLPPGDYALRVASALPDGVWHTSENSFRFTILPPFWKTWWFTLCLALTGCVILYRIFISFQRKLRTEKLLNAFATSLYGQHTVDDILWDAARNCVRKLNFTNCVIYKVDTKRNVLLLKAVWGLKNLYNKETVNVTEIALDKGITGAVARSGRSERVKNTARDPRYIRGSEKALSELTVPIRVDGEIFGVIDSEHPRRNFYKRYHLRLLEKMADICAERILKYFTEEKLRGKIARDLHDEMGSTLTSIHIMSKIAGRHLQENTPEKKHITKINRHASGMMEKMSDMIWAINPSNDSFDHLMYRIKEYAVEVLESLNISLSFRELENAKRVKLNPEQRKNIYLIAKEALNNTVKYSSTSKVDICFKEENNMLKMHISDNGKGYDASVSHKGNGIKNMFVRAEEINATLQIDTSPGKGVSLLLSLTIEKT